VIKVVPGPVKVALLILGALLVAAGAAVAVGRRRRKVLVAEVEVMQAALVPAVPERLNGLALSAAYRPAEGPGAGGDFYDVVPLDEHRVAIVLGDVSGHGREAVARSTSMRYTLHAYLEARLAGEKLQSESFGFATAVLAVHDAVECTLSYASAGHPPPIVLGPPAWDPPLAASSPPVGVGAPTGLSQTTVALPAGSLVCFFTDGLEEARCGEELLGRERLHELVGELGADGLAAALLERVEAEADRAPDDMAALIARTEDGPPAADLRIEELELAPADTPRAERFLEACGVGPEGVLQAIEAMQATPGAPAVVLLRVTVRGGQSSVKVLSRASSAVPALASAKAAQPAIAAA
jgi:serine phosphatase RsbU (regulator of sigma subunit)